MQNSQAVVSRKEASWPALAVDMFLLLGACMVLSSWGGFRNYKAHGVLRWQDAKEYGTWRIGSNTGHRERFLKEVDSAGTNWRNMTQCFCQLSKLQLKRSLELRRSLIFQGTTELVQQSMEELGSYCEQRGLGMARKIWRCSVFQLSLVSFVSPCTPPLALSARVLSLLEFLLLKMSPTCWTEKSISSSRCHNERVTWVFSCISVPVLWTATVPMLNLYFGGSLLSTLAEDAFWAFLLWFILLAGRFGLFVWKAWSQGRWIVGATSYLLAYSTGTGILVVAGLWQANWEDSR